MQIDQIDEDTKKIISYRYNRGQKILNLGNTKNIKQITIQINGQRS